MSELIRVDKLRSVGALGDNDVARGHAALNLLAHSQVVIQIKAERVWLLLQNRYLLMIVLNHNRAPSFFLSTFTRRYDWVLGLKTRICEFMGGIEVGQQELLLLVHHLLIGVFFLHKNWLILRRLQHLNARVCGRKYESLLADCADLPDAVEVDYRNGLKLHASMRLMPRLLHLTTAFGLHFEVLKIARREFLNLLVLIRFLWLHLGEWGPRLVPLLIYNTKINVKLTEDVKIHSQCSFFILLISLNLQMN